MSLCFFLLLWICVLIYVSIYFSITVEEILEHINKGLHFEDESEAQDDEAPGRSDRVEAMPISSVAIAEVDVAEGEETLQPLGDVPIPHKIPLALYRSAEAQMALAEERVQMEQRRNEKKKKTNAKYKQTLKAVSDAIDVFNHEVRFFSYFNLIFIF